MHVSSCPRSLLRREEGKLQEELSDGGDEARSGGAQQRSFSSSFFFSFFCFCFCFFCFCFFFFCFFSFSFFLPCFFFPRPRFSCFFLLCFGRIELP
jgi:hypothetical protein